jgi:LPXTG-motif cell wall-anchored protein
MNPETYASIVRHVVTGIGVSLTAKGYGDAASWEAAAGLIIAVGGWFLFRRKK